MNEGRARGLGDVRLEVCGGDRLARGVAHLERARGRGRARLEVAQRVVAHQLGGGDRERDAKQHHGHRERRDGRGQDATTQGQSSFSKRKPMPRTVVM